MTYRLLKAKEMVSQWQRILKEEVTSLRVIPKLVIFLVGDDVPSQIYTQNKQRFAHNIGALCQIVKFPHDVREEDLSKSLLQAAKDKEVHGILLQLPLPQALRHRTSHFIELIPAAKDVDGLTINSMGQLAKEQHDGLSPCTPRGIITLLKGYNIPLQGQNVTIIGKGPLVGKPLALELLKLGATVTICHRQTKNLKEHLLCADIIVLATGQAKFFTADFLPKRDPQRPITLIDVGIHKLDDNSYCGDVDFSSVAPLVDNITPVPGGVGPMTILGLAQNLLQACRQQKS